MTRITLKYIDIAYDDDLDMYFDLNTNRHISKEEAYRRMKESTTQKEKEKENEDIPNRNL